MNYLAGFLFGLLIFVLVLEPKNEMTIKTEPITYQSFAEQLGQHYKPIYQKRLKEAKIANDLRCLTDNVYHEAANEPLEGQLAVATVVMNRVKSPDYPKSVCGVVYERHVDPRIHKIVCQFSWTCKPKKKLNKTAYQQAKQIAKEVLFKHQSIDLNGATLYHALYVHPDWADRSEQVQQIGTHIFYKE